MMKQLITLASFCLATISYLWVYRIVWMFLRCSSNIQAESADLERNLYRFAFILSQIFSSFLMSPKDCLMGRVIFCRFSKLAQVISFCSAGLVMKNRTNISTKLIQGITIDLSISLLSNIGKALQRRSMRSGPLLLSLDQVEMTRSTSHIKIRIIAKIQTLKAYLTSDFFLFIRLTNVQITKKDPEPMIVLKMKLGNLKAHAYSASDRPKESQVSLRAGCVKILRVYQRYLIWGQMPLGFYEQRRKSSALRLSPQLLSQTMLKLLETPKLSQRLQSLKNMNMLWLTKNKVIANARQVMTVFLLMFSSAMMRLDIIFWAWLQMNTFMIIWMKKRVEVARQSPDISFNANKLICKNLKYLIILVRQ